MRRYKGEKGKAWEVVKKYIRERDKWKCFTCHKRITIPQDAQAGHWIPVGVCGSNNTLGWDERNIHLQCHKCNCNRGGWGERYTEMMEIKYGKEVVEELRKRRFKIDPIKDWVKMKEDYKKKLDLIENNA